MHCGHGLGQEVTFGPTSPNTKTVGTIDGGSTALGVTEVTCPSATQCTALDSRGEVTVDPTEPSTPIYQFFSGEAYLFGIACPSADQCTAVDNAGGEVTFHPANLTANLDANSGGTLPKPVLDKGVVGQVKSGTILIEPPGSRTFIRLTGTQFIPMGSTVDATHGKVLMNSAVDSHGDTATGIFYAGVFKVTQTIPKPKATTVLTLAGPRPGGCHTIRALIARHRPRSRRLWGSANGSFRAVGTNASASERGTTWLTEDECAGTLISVTQDSVLIDDFSHHRKFVLRAPHSFLAHPGKNG
jgi:hypothetical protein